MYAISKDSEVLVSVDMAEIVEVHQVPTFMLVKGDGDFLPDDEEPRQLSVYPYSIFINGMQMGDYLTEEDARYEMEQIMASVMKGANLYRMCADRHVR